MAYAFGGSNPSPCTKLKMKYLNRLNFKRLAYLLAALLAFAALLLLVWAIFIAVLFRNYVGIEN